MRTRYVHDAQTDKLCVPESEKVVGALGHLLLIDVDEAIVQPKPTELLPSHRFRLHDFIRVMRKHQITSSAVNINAIAE